MSDTSLGRFRPRPHPQWGNGLEYLLGACLVATGVVSAAGQFPTGYAVSAAFVLGFAGSAVWRLFRGDPRRVGLQFCAVLAWLGWFRGYWLWATGGLGAQTFRGVGVGFVLAGLLVIVLLGRARRRAVVPGGR